jgi:hypothetical protein
MDDSTVINIILLLGNLNLILAIAVGVRKGSWLWGIMTWLFAPLVLLGIVIMMLASGRRQLPNPQPYNAPGVYHH